MRQRLKAWMRSRRGKEKSNDTEESVAKEEATLNRQTLSRRQCAVREELNPLPFQYEPFADKSGWIRLLRFLPGDPLRCELHHYKLVAAPQYIALSYAWGDPTPSVPINIGGSEILVTESLSIAIYRLRDRVMKEKCMFWADSICINQQDRKERAEQVEQMSSVYETAGCVFSWLGDEFDGCDVALTQMRRWAEAMDNQSSRRRSEYLSNLKASDPFFYGSPDSDGYKAWPGILKLCKSPWWVRAWVVQEVLLARNLRIFCGPYEVPLKWIFAAINVEGELTQRHDIKGLYVDSGLPISLLSIRENYINDYSGSKLPFLKVLESLRFFQSSDPRDRVYSAIGIARDVFEGDVKPDYSKRVGEVFTEATASCFHAAPLEEKLDFLGHVHQYSQHLEEHHSKNDNILPTWVPDWCLHRVYYPFLKKLSTTHHDPVYHASGNSKVDARIDGSVFLVHGFIIDEIASLQRTVTTQRHENIRTERLWEPGDRQKPYTSGGNVEKAWLHSICADVRRDWAGGLARGNAITWSQMTPSTWTNESAFSSMKCATLNRRLLTTGKEYIGIGPGASDIGDKVAVFFGGQMLYVIRETGDGEYVFLGEAYVHGLMDGEAMEEGRVLRNVQEFKLI